MAIKIKSFQDYAALADHIRTGQRTLFVSSKTSTVLPYEHLAAHLPQADAYMLGELGTLPQKLELTEDGLLQILGPVNWKEARAFCRSHGRDIMAAPTEELAAVLAGLATSATGERSFGFGAIRDQVASVTYLDYQGNERVLQHSHPLGQTEASDLLRAYQADFIRYRNFKNGPFPRMERQTDLMIGTEGQLGVITQAKLQTVPFEEVNYIFFSLPPWEDDTSAHLQIFHAVQALRGKILSCELLDSHSLSYLPENQCPVKGADLVFLEIAQIHFDEIYESLLSRLPVPEDKIFEMTAQRCRELRMAVPRGIFEANARMGVTKKGTDAQVSPEHFPALLDHYKLWARESGLPFVLFGHFGDAHLHFNFMPTPIQEHLCSPLFDGLYAKILEWKGSPFAEHGIGLLKRDFIAPFHGPAERAWFEHLKQKMDPHGVFFPDGFMGTR